jgi:hypothetical protein
MHRAISAVAVTALITLVLGCSNEGDPHELATPPADLNAAPDGGDPAAVEPQAPSPDSDSESEEETPSSEEDAPAATPPDLPPPPVPKSKMTFFVTSKGNAGGNFGGLKGADKKCQDLAKAVNGGDHTWHAYLSAARVNAKDRIGPGPWQNQKGTVIAENVAALHDYLFVPANANMLDEKGAAIPAARSRILTGSKHDGTATGQTCNNWTSSSGNQQGRIGDAFSASNNQLGVRWNDALKNSGCSQQSLTQNKSEGRLYCFAID